MGTDKTNAEQQTVVVVNANDLINKLEEALNTHLQDLNKASSKEQEDTLLTPLEVCKMLKVHRMTLQAWKNKGYLVPAMIGGRCFYKKSIIDEIINNKR